jgi:hypothetical protein
MTQQQQKSAKPDPSKEQDRSPARSKDQGRNDQQQSEDLPGADGPNSAGANEDTYD